MASMRRLIALLAVVFVALLTPATAQAHHKPNHNKGGSTSPSPTVQQIHDYMCPRVVDYLDCSTITVKVANYGPTGYYATSGPAYKVVEYNTYYTQTTAGWERTVSHEMGGHHDAWAELSVRGTNPWQDYYDLDVFAWDWLNSHGYTFYKSDGTKNTELTKEMYLDCVGPVAHGYQGNYLSSRSVSTTVCTDAYTVMNRALTENR